MAARLFQTTSVEEEWRLVAGPWLREQASAAWKNPRPTAVVTPSRAECFYLRGRLVAERVPVFGIYFWTPSDARKFLTRELNAGALAATRADLQLLARSCAEKLLSRKNEPDDAILRSVVRDPKPFLRAYDLLLGAGWDPAADGAACGRPLAREFGRELERRMILTQAGLHRRLFDTGRAQKEPLIANLLVTGFNATHWPLWDLLRALVGVSEEALVVLSAPRVFGEEIDQLWIGSWEEETKKEIALPEGGSAQNEPNAFDRLVASYERGEADNEVASDIAFLVTPDLASQVRAVVLQALDYLERNECTRLGIVFPEPNALALGVAEELARLGIPLDNGTGAIQPGPFERRFWQAWLAWQEEPSVARFIHWLRACEAQGVSSGLADSSWSARKVADLLQGALGETLADDLDFLARHLGQNSRRDDVAGIADFLRNRIELPPAASFAEFLATTRRALDALGWEDHLAALPTGPPAWLQRGEMTLSRRAFLEWLKESTDSREATRGTEGNHFYGRVHLLIYAQITGQTWSHLILTGLNEGVWPRVYEAGAFGSRYELAELNRQARSLNRRVTGEGGQGSGHEAVRADRGHCLLPLEQRDLALRDVCAAMEETRHAVALAAMILEAGRSLLPSDFFNHAHQAGTGQALDEATFQRLALATSDWCARHDELFRQAEPDENSIAATRRAHAARRDATQPFGRYEFAYAEPPERPIQLPCKAWETAWNDPASVWLKEIVGVPEWPEGALIWPQTIGTWVHRWLGQALRLCRERNSTRDFLPILRDIVERAPTAGLYPWWNHVCHHAKGIALGLGESLAPCLENQAFLFEWKLPDRLFVALPGAARPDFELRGRIDLLLLESGSAADEPGQADFSGRTSWVIDFKTGAARALTAKKIGRGTGLQAVLYALAVRALGAGSTAISFHTPGAALRKQVKLDEALESEPLFRSLDLLHRAGIFGQRHSAESEYGFAPDYPMATRPVPTDILEAKWTLVHGAGAAAEEEDES